VTLALAVLIFGGVLIYAGVTGSSVADLLTGAGKTKADNRSLEDAASASSTSGGGGSSSSSGGGSTTTATSPNAPAANQFYPQPAGAPASSIPWWLIK